MQYKALFLDLDGTTVPHFSDTPNPRVVSAIAKLQKKMHVCIATGRLYYQAVPIIEKLGVLTHCVVANGIQIYDPKQKNIAAEIKINPKDIVPVSQILKSYQPDVHYFNGETEQLYQPHHANQKILSFYIPKISTEQVNALTQDLKKFPDIVVHKLVTKENNILAVEICHASATKQHGILTVAENLGIKTHEIVGVGDGYNDFPLLMACGLKFAMGNAVPELKEIADFVAPSVENDGVAVIIEKFLLPLLEK